MSIKTTRRISREKALAILMVELTTMSNDMLGVLLDQIADSGQSQQLSIFDNFIVSIFTDEDDDGR